MRNTYAQIENTARFGQNLIAENAQLEDELEELQQQLNSLEGEGGGGGDDDQRSMQKRLKELEKLIAEREHEANSLEDRKAALLDQMEDQDNMIQQLREETQRLDGGKVVDKQQQVEDQRSRLHRLYEELDEMKAKTQAAQDETSRLHQQTAELKERKEQQKEGLSDIINENQQLRQKLKEDEEKLHAEEEDLEAEEEEVMRMAEDYEEIETRYEELEAQIEEEQLQKEEKLNELRNLLEQKTAEVQDWEEKCFQKRQSLDFVLQSTQGKKKGGDFEDNTEDLSPEEEEKIAERKKNEEEQERIERQNAELREKLDEAEAANEALPLEKELKELNAKHSELTDAIEALERHKRRKEAKSLNAADAKKRLMDELEEEKEELKAQHAELEHGGSAYEEALEREEAHAQELASELAAAEQKHEEVAKDAEKELKKLQEQQEEEWAEEKKKHEARYEEIERKRKKVQEEQGEAVAQQAKLQEENAAEQEAEAARIELERQQKKMEEEIAEMDKKEKENEEHIARLKEEKAEQEKKSKEAEFEQEAEKKKVEEQLRQLKSEEAAMQESLAQIHKEGESKEEPSESEGETEVPEAPEEPSEEEEVIVPSQPTVTLEKVLVHLQGLKKPLAPVSRYRLLELMPMDALQILEEHGNEDSEIVFQKCMEAQRISKASGAEVLERLGKTDVNEGAKDALLGLPASDAMRILVNLEEKGSEVKDASAFVSQSVAKSLQTVSQSVQLEFQAKLKKCSALNSQAKAAIMELRPADGIQVLMDLDKEKLSKDKQSSYVMKAVAKAHHFERDVVLEELHTRMKKMDGLSAKAKESFMDLPPQMGLKILVSHEEAGLKKEKFDFEKEVEKAHESLGEASVGKVRERLNGFPDLSDEAKAALLDLPPDGALVILGHLEAKKTEIQDHSAFVLNAAAKLHAVQVGTRGLLLKVRSGGTVSTDTKEMVKPGGGLLAKAPPARPSQAGNAAGEAKKKNLRDRLIALTAERDEMQTDIDAHRKQQADASVRDAFGGVVHGENPRDEQMAAILTAEAEEIRRGLRWALEEERRALQEQQTCVIS